MILFNIISGGRKGTTIKLEDSLITIGRLPCSTLRLDPYEDIYVHGKHANIYLKSNEYYLEDLETKNGTFLNNIMITSPIPIKKGDIIKLGKEGTEILIEDLLIPEVKEESKGIKLFRKETGESFIFFKDNIIIGREQGCDLQLNPEKDIHVSGSHALIKKKVDGYYLEDLNSANGSYVNKFPCQTSKLENGDIISLGASGVTFEFNLIKFEPSDETNKPLKNRKKLIKSSQNTYYKYICILVIIGIFLITSILLIIGKDKSIKKEINLNTIKNNYKKGVILIYNRYLIFKDNKEFRGCNFGTGILYKDKNKIYIITNKEVIYPWKKNLEGNIYIEEHKVAGWLYNSHMYLEKDHPFWRPIDVPIFDFSNTINNDIDRIGGVGKINIPNQINLEKDNKICYLEVTKAKEYLIDYCFSSKFLSNKISNKIYCVYYPEPLESNLKKIIPLALESNMKEINFQLAIKLSGNPIINSDGKFIALVSFENNKLEYNFFRNNK